MQDSMHIMYPRGGRVAVCTKESSAFLPPVPCVRSCTSSNSSRQGLSLGCRRYACMCTDTRHRHRGHMIAAAIAKKSPTHTAARSARPSLAIEDRQVVPAIGQSMEFAQDSSRWHNARDILRRQHRFAVPCLERRRRVEEPVLRPVRTPGRGDKHVARRRRQPAEHMHCLSRRRDCSWHPATKVSTRAWGPAPRLAVGPGAAAVDISGGWSRQWRRGLELAPDQQRAQQHHARQQRGKHDLQRLRQRRT